MGPILGGVPRMKFSSTTAAIIFDGNSLVAGYGASNNNSLPSQLAALAPLNSAVSMGNTGVTGQNITGMRTRGASVVDGAYAAGKKNILFAWEGTNTICNNDSNANKTGLQAAADMVLYCQDRLAAHPGQVIILVTAMPRFDTHNRTVAQQEVELSAYNDYLLANYRDMGAKAIVDVRAGGVFTYTGPTMSAAMSPYMSDTVHCNDAGYALIARYCADVLKRLPAR